MAKTPQEYHLLRTYGITLEQYNELLNLQSHRCNVCKRHEDEFKTRLAVDHHHGTGEIRGLLCTHCNRRVIGRHTSSEIFRNAAEHLDAHTGWFVPTKKKKKRKKSVKTSVRIRK